MHTKTLNAIATSICILFLVALPCGTAAQSMVLFLTGLLGLGLTIWQRPTKLWNSNRWETLSIAAYSFFCMWLSISSLLNPKNLNDTLLENFVGYIGLAALPPILGYCWHIQSKKSEFWDRLTNLLLVVWALICLSQAIIGWQLVGSGIEFSPRHSRARGFYSHPLTLAYVLLMLWPFQLLQLWRKPRSLTPWIKSLAFVTMFILSSSRTVQVCALLAVIWSILSLLRGRKRQLALGVILFSCLTIITTPNPLSHRFSDLLSESNPDRFSSYPDDRLAFWHAFSHLIAERPVLGHGINLDRGYRLPYYKAIGLGDFPKQYEAHNQFIQILAESGLIGLTAFLCWLFCIIHAYPQSKINYSLVWHLTVGLFVLSGMTQNAFQDSEVRYALILLLSLAKAMQFEQNDKISSF